MQRLSAVLLATCLLALGPARAEDETRTFRFTHLSAYEAQEYLVEPNEDPARGRIRPFVLDGRAGPRGLVPPGIKAWSVDETANGLVVTGEQEAITQLERLIRLIDIPRRTLKLADAGRKAAEAAPASVSTALKVSNNRPLGLAVPGRDGGTVLLSVIPRINGDNSVTLIILRSGLPEAAPEGRSMGMLAAQRAAAGETIAIAGGPLRETLVIRAEILIAP